MSKQGLKQPTYLRCQIYFLYSFFLCRMTPKEIMRRFCWHSVAVTTNGHSLWSKLIHLRSLLWKPWISWHILCPELVWRTDKRNKHWHEIDIARAGAFRPHPFPPSSLFFSTKPTAVWLEIQCSGSLISFCIFILVLARETNHRAAVVKYSPMCQSQAIIRLTLEGAWMCYK